MNGRDPITKFLTRQRGIKSELSAAKRPSKSQIFEDPKKYCNNFMQTLEDRLEESIAAQEALTELEEQLADITSDTEDDDADGEEAAADAEARNARTAERQRLNELLEAARDVFDSCRTDITGDIIDKLDKDVQKWMNGEAYIYNLAIESLKKKTALQVKTLGAGRLQIKKLEESHNRRTPKTTATMVHIWDHMQILKTETIEDFRERWDELMNDMQNAKPDPLVRTKGEKRIKYLEAFEKGRRFVEEHKEFKKSRTEIVDMESWFTTLENKGSLELLTRHSMNTAGFINMPSAEIYVYESSRKNPRDRKKKWNKKKKQKCFEYARTGNCRRGDECRYAHEDSAKPSPSARSPKRQPRKKKPKSQIECKFNKRGNCNKGNKCEYRHSAKASVSNLSAYDLVDIQEERQTNELYAEESAVNTNFTVDTESDAESGYVTETNM